MQPWHLNSTPAHPSLPIAPHLRQQPLQGGSQSHYPNSMYTPQAIQPQMQYGVASHYAQAYMQHNFPGMPQQTHMYQPQASTSQVRLPNPLPSARWHQPGGVRCKKQGCSFTGSQKAVETHMMDRHLIYPAGWEHRKRKDDWDADPSLKGKTIPIQGTTLKLETPEDIEKWIAERKKRFPTAERVAEKQQKMTEAVARGQLAFPDQRFPNKKRRLDNDSQHGTNGRGSMRGRGRGRGRGGMQNQRHRGPSDTTQPTNTPHVSGANSIALRSTAATHKAGRIVPSEANESSASDSDSDAPPEVVSSKGPVLAQSLDDTHQAGSLDVEADGQVAVDHRPPLKAAPKPQPRQPRRPQQNPFASRPALLRNLLLPEIRMTVSNLSQAIRFLVDNDFLENVELKPGQAERKMIQVMDDGNTNEQESVKAIVEEPTA